MFVGCLCVFMEDFFMLGNCIEMCKSVDCFEFGCSIGRFLDEFFGLVGFMYKLRNLSVFKFGFLIVLYVVIKNCYELYSFDELYELIKYCFG